MKRFYIILFSVLCLSVILLGLSYSQESTDNTIGLNEEVATDLRVIYSANPRNIEVIDSITRDISITNRLTSSNSYFIYINTTNPQDITYSLDNKEEIPLTKKLIYIGNLNSFGQANDQVTHQLQIYNKSNNPIKVDLAVVKDNHLLKDYLLNDSQVYIDTEENYRYYGSTVNNYLKYNDQIYQIVGLINNKIKIVRFTDTLDAFGDSNNYLTLYDYFQSFNSSSVTLENSSNYQTWLNQVSDYWLLDTDGETKAYCVTNGSILLEEKTNLKNNYEVIDLLNDIKIIEGDGSYDHPYEVAYES